MALNLRRGLKDLVARRKGSLSKDALTIKDVDSQTKDAESKSKDGDVKPKATDSKKGHHQAKA